MLKLPALSVFATLNVANIEAAKCSLRIQGGSREVDAARDEKGKPARLHVLVREVGEARRARRSRSRQPATSMTLMNQAET